MSAPSHTAGPVRDLLVPAVWWGFGKPILGNALIWAGAFPQAVGPAGRNVHSIGFNTNESAPDIKGHDEFAARYVKFAMEKTKQAQPINVANTTLARDALMLLTSTPLVPWSPHVSASSGVNSCGTMPR